MIARFLIATFMVVFAFCLFMLPAIIAIDRKAKDWRWIVLLNAIGGLTGIGWVVALIWSIAGARETTPGVHEVSIVVDHGGRV